MPLSRVPTLVVSRTPFPLSDSDGTGLVVFRLSPSVISQSFMSELLRLPELFPLPCDRRVGRLYGDVRMCHFPLAFWMPSGCPI